jgi:large subunit ribosomal protein L28
LRHDDARSDRSTVSALDQESETREMSKVCSVCGKHPSAGRNVSHSHRVTNRTIRPNIQRVSAVIDGSVKKINVCTKCMKAGKITRA